MENNKNVILITIDCLRADHVGFMGYNRNTTPFLDSLARKSAVFTNAFSAAPYTTASFTSIFTGTYPIYKGNVLIKDRTTLAEILRDHNYWTVGVHSNAQFSRFLDYGKGFVVFEDLEIFSDRPDKKENSLKSVFFSYARKIYQSSPSSVKNILSKSYYLFTLKLLKSQRPPYASAVETTRKAFQHLEQSSFPFFLWIHYMDTHHPYFPPEQFFEELSNQKLDILKGIRFIKRILHSRYNPTDEEKQFVIDLYDASIRYVDYAISLLFEFLDEHGFLDNTYVIITADHGEELWDHGHYGHGAQIGRPMKLYNEMIHVPLLIFGPDIKHSEIQVPVSLVDIAPTVLNVLGVEYLGRSDGRNIMNTLQKKRPVIAESISPGDPLDYMRSQNKYELYAYIANGWKYIHYTTDKRKDELYNLREDPKESINLIDEYPEIASELKMKILEHIQRKMELSTEKTKIASTIQKLKLAGKI